MMVACGLTVSSRKHCSYIFWGKQTSLRCTRNIFETEHHNHYCHNLIDSVLGLSLLVKHAFIHKRNNRVHMIILTCVKVNVKHKINEIHFRHYIYKTYLSTAHFTGLRGTCKFDGVLVITPFFTRKLARSSITTSVSLVQYLLCFP